MIQRLFLLTICATLVCFAGCGSEGRKAPVPVYKVRGVVKFKGKPVANADVTFQNVETQRSAFGRTNEQGEYTMTTFNLNDGAVEGKHNVIISKLVPPQEVKPVADIESEAYVPPTGGKSTDPAPPKNEFPDKYAKFETSGLIAVVNKDTENVVDFDLSE